MDATIIPARNAPIAMDRPTYTDSSAMVKVNPRMETITTSWDTLSASQFMAGGIRRSPTKMLRPMNTMMLRIMMIRPLASISLPAIIGERMDSSTTWAMSSTMSTRISISLWSRSRMFVDLWTARTTAVLEPDMMAPNARDSTIPKPMRVPAM